MKRSLIMVVLLVIFAFGCTSQMEKQVMDRITDPIECGIDVNGIQISCIDGDCYVLPNSEQAAPTCIVGDPCIAADCAGECVILESYPSKVVCK